MFKTLKAEGGVFDLSEIESNFMGHLKLLFYDDIKINSECRDSEVFGLSF